MLIENLISLLSGIALFLFGMSLMGDGLKKVAGSKLELFLYKLSNTTPKGIALGAGVTAVIQSSSATSVMVVGFVNSSMVKLRQAIGIILGAVLGTSITGWIIALSEIGGGGTASWLSLLSTSTLTGVVAVAGILLRMFCKSLTKKRVGDILLGFAILMTGMSIMSDSVSFLRESETFTKVITEFSNPILGILAGTGITLILQSASASIGILQALSVTGAITFDTALPIVMGISIGAALPVLLSALGAGVEGKRAALSYLVINTSGTVIVSAVYYISGIFVSYPFASSVVGMVDIALINTIFRLVTVLLLSPAIPLVEKIVCRVFKTDPEQALDNAEIDRLEDRFVAHPAVAIEQSNAAVCAMARKARKNLSRSIELLDSFSEELYSVIQQKEEVIDRYEDKLGSYLVKLTGKEMTSEQSRKISLFLHTIGDFERIGDHAVNLSKVAREIHEKHIVFSELAQKELNTLVSAVSEIVVHTTDAFISGDVALAGRVEPLEQVIDDLCDEIKIHHIRRVQSGDCTIELGFTFNDLLTNYERIADHCSNIAVAMIELAQDSFDTHEYLNDVKTNRSEEFNRYFAEYDERYKI